MLGFAGRSAIGWFAGLVAMGATAISIAATTDLPPRSGVDPCAAFPVTVLAGTPSKSRDSSIYADTADRIERYLESVTQFTINATMSRTWDWPARPPDRVKPTSGKMTYTATATMGTGSLHAVFFDSSQRIVGIMATPISTQAKPFIERMEGADGCLTALLTVSWLDDPPLFSKRIRNESEYKGTKKIKGRECHIFVRRYQELDPYYLRVDTYYIPMIGIPLPVKWKYDDHYLKDRQPWTVVQNEYTITDSIWKPEPQTETRGRPGS